MLKKILLSTLLCTTITTPLIGKVNAEEMKQDKPVKYVFKSGGKASPIFVNSDATMTIPEKEILEVYIEMPSDFYVVKNGVKTNEVTPKYKHIWDQWAYYDFYASKGRTADLFVGEHPRPLDGEIFVPKYDNTSDNTKVDDKIDNQNNVNDKNNDQKDEPKNDQTEPNKNATDNQSMTEQPKQNVPAKVEQPAKDDGKVDKKDTADQSKDNTNKDNKAIANNKSNDQNKVAMNNQKSEPQSADTSKQVDVKKEDNSKDVKAKATDNKAKAADNKSDKQQKELPKTGKIDSTWLRNGLVILSAFIVLGIYRLSRKYEV